MTAVSAPEAAPEATTTEAAAPELAHSEADLQLMAVLKDVADGAKHAADPREPAAKLAAALLTWFETPNEVEA